MKHAIPLALCSVAVAGLALLAVNTHRDYIHQLNFQNTKVAVQQAKVKLRAVLAAHKQAEATEAKQKKLESNCLAYAAKARVAKPDCSL